MREVIYFNVTRSSKQPGLLSSSNATIVEKGVFGFILCINTQLARVEMDNGTLSAFQRMVALTLNA